MVKLLLLFTFLFSSFSYATESNKFEYLRKLNQGHVYSPSDKKCSEAISYDINQGWVQLIHTKNRLYPNSICRQEGSREIYDCGSQSNSCVAFIDNYIGGYPIISEFLIENSTFSIKNYYNDNDFYNNRPFSNTLYYFN